MTDLAAKATEILNRLGSCAFHYDIEIDEAAKPFRVIRCCELMDDEAGDMGIPPQDDHQIVLEAASAVELYQKIIDM